MKKIIGFVGHIASGKGAACDYFIERHDAGYHKFSTMLADLCDRLYLPHNRDNLIRMSECIRHEFGEDTMARVIAADVENDAHDIICIDGIRRLADIAELRKLPDFVLVSIDADVRVRFERLAARHEKIDDATKTFEQFLADEQRPTERSIDAVAAEAHRTLANNGSIEKFHAALDTLVQSS
jgi:dephospho-CoA kinase